MLSCQKRRLSVVVLDVLPKKVNALYGKEVTSAAAWACVSNGSLKKSDAKYKNYLGVQGSDSKSRRVSGSSPSHAPSVRVRRA